MFQTAQLPMLTAHLIEMVIPWPILNQMCTVVLPVIPTYLALVEKSKSSCKEQTNQYYVIK